MINSKYCNLRLKPDLSRKHCKYDSGGYFIINGSEKVVMSVESIIHRKPMVFTKKDQNSLIYYVQVQSRPATQFVGNTQVFTIRIKKDGSIILAIPHFKEISIFTLMRALGLETDEEIVNSLNMAGKNFGIAYQIADDIKDCDTSKNEANYAKIFGKEKSLERINYYLNESITILKSLPFNTDKLIEIFNLIKE